MHGWPLRQLSREYGMEVLEVEPIGQILTLTTDKGRYALKKTNLLPEELTLEYEVCQHLRIGFKRVARIIPTRAGNCFAQIGKNRYLLTAWIEANQADFTDPEQLQISVRGLAEFHRAATGYSGNVFWQKRRLYGVWPQRFSFRLGHIEYYRRLVLARGTRNEFDDLFLGYADEALKQGTQAVQKLRTGNYYRLANRARNKGTLCHHDFAYHNVLIDGQKKVWLIDFDYCILDMPLHDLGSLILRVVKTSNWSFEPAERILLIYHEENPCEPGEIEVLHGFMEYPQDFWQLAWANYSEVGMHKPEHLLVRLKRFLDSTEARHEFLRKFSFLKL